MYGRPNGKKYKKDGTLYPISYSYVCRSSSGENGHICTHKTQYGEKKLEQEVKAIIVGLVNDKNFSNLLSTTLSEGLDVDKLKKDIENDRKELRRLGAAQERTEALILEIDYTDTHAERQEQSLQRRLNAIFDQMQEAEKRIAYAQERIENAEQKDNAKASIQEFLEHFQDYYEIMEDEDKKALLCAIIESIELYPKSKQSGQWIKAIHFNFPMLYHGEEIVSLNFSPSESHVESVACLSRKQVDDKKQAFFNNAKLLADTLGITPLMYGSLGLEYLTGKNLNADDIDILIPRTFLADRWHDFQTVLEKDGYTLIDEHEHTFEKEGIHYSYAQVEELESFAGIPVSEIQTLENGNVHFKLLSLQQYLKVYTASAKDGYRINTKYKKDSEKIALIQNQLSFQPKESKDESVVTLVKTGAAE